MARQQCDLTIEEVLDDPMILAIRRADRVEATAFEALLRSRALDLAGRRPDTVPTADPVPGAGEIPAHLCRRMLDGFRQGACTGSSRAW